MDKYFKLKVDDSLEYKLKESDLDQLDLLKLSKSKFHIIHNNQSIPIELEKANFNNREYLITVNTTCYKVKIFNQLDVLIKDMGFSAGKEKKENEIKAPMPGAILNVNVKEGQSVTQGETLLILEAMKMENAITASNNGIVKKIYVKNGGKVEKGELMIEIA
jgi:biotin carboxyl carrier protein